MSDAIITIISSVLVAMISAFTSLGLVNWRLQQIEKKLDVHNGYAEKFGEITADIKLIQKDIEFIKKEREE